jgi:hypothetical protein
MTDDITTNRVAHVTDGGGTSMSWTHTVSDARMELLVTYIGGRPVAFVALPVDENGVPTDD